MFAVELYFERLMNNLIEFNKSISKGFKLATTCTCSMQQYL